MLPASVKRRFRARCRAWGLLAPTGKTDSPTDSQLLQQLFAKLCAKRASQIIKTLHDLPKHGKIQIDTPGCVAFDSPYTR